MPNYQPQLISSTHGRIDHLVIVLPGIATEASEQEYQAIIDCFEADREVLILQHDPPNVQLRVVPTGSRTIDAESEGASNPNVTRPIHRFNRKLDLEALLRGWKDELDELNQNKELFFKRWVQDPFLVLDGGPFQVLLHSFYNNRLSDHFLVLELAEKDALSFYTKPTVLKIEGGNVLCQDGTAFVGEDLIQQNLELHQWKRIEALEILGQSLGVQRIIPVGFPKPKKKLFHSSEQSWQPLFHIDLFLTLGGRDSTTQKSVAFLACPRITESMLPAEASDFQRSDLKHEYHAYFDQVRNSIPEDFTIIDVPIFFQDGKCFSWNNSLVEIYGEIKRIYLPSYRCDDDRECLNTTFEILEEAVEKAYQFHGFETVWIRSGRFFRILASHGGSLHCVVKVLKRGEGNTYKM